MLADEGFVRSIGDLSARLSTFGAANALAQVVLKMASPGVADTYQGTETFQMSLVDPDNRGPVDYASLGARLARLTRPEGDRRRFAEGCLSRYADGDVKLYLVHRALTLRRRHPAVFAGGTYRALDGGEHLVGFVREGEGQAIVCAVARHSFRRTRGEAPWAIGPVWGDDVVEWPPGRYRDAFTGVSLDAKGPVRVADVLRSLPVALLVRDEPGAPREMKS